MHVKLSWTFLGSLVARLGSALPGALCWQESACYDMSGLDSRFITEVIHVMVLKCDAI